MDRKPSPVRLPLHSDVSLLAERHREILCKPHQKAPQAWRISLPPGTQRCHPPLPRRHQCKPKALYLDQGPQQNHRRRQARAPNVRFNPLELFFWRVHADLRAFETSRGAGKRPTLSRSHTHAWRFTEGAMQRADDVAALGPRKGIKYVLSLT